MSRIILLILFCSADLISQETSYLIQLRDLMLRKEKPVARITVTDTLSNMIAQGYSDTSGCFRFSTVLSVIQLKVDSAKETCEGVPANYSARIDLTYEKDTIQVRLMHIFIDKWPLPLIFDEGSLLFTTLPDSAERCTFSNPDDSCSGFHSLQVLLNEYNMCGAFRKLEIKTYYTANEAEQHGNSLALQRADSCISYLKANGMKTTEFVVQPVLYSKRPIKNPDGTIHTEEMCLIMFRILEW